MAVRLYTFLANRSLWLDELMLAENIIGRDFGSLVAPLANQQVAPRGAWLYLYDMSDTDDDLPLPAR